MSHERDHRAHRSGPPRVRALTLVTAFLALLLLPVTATTVAAAPELPADSGWVRFGHFAPSAGGVDVFVDGTLLANDITFRTVSDYVPVASGPHEFEIRATGEELSDPVLSVQAGVPVNGSVTIGAVTTRDGIASQIYTDELVQPAPDTSLVRFIHAAPDVQAVDVAVVGGPALATDVPYPTATGYSDIAPGTYDVEVRAAGTDDVVLRVTGWTIDPGVQSSIVIVRGLDGQLDVAPIRDAVAAPVAPDGGIQTGGGAMADVLDPIQPGSSFPSSGVIFAALGAMAAIGTAATVTGRRIRRS